MLHSSKWGSYIQSARTRLRADCGPHHELPIVKSSLKLKKVGKTTSPFSSVQFSSVAQSCPIIWDPMNCSTPGLPVHHKLPEFTQTHVHWVSDTIQPFHPLSSPSLPAFNLSQHQGLFQWSVLPIRWPKYWSFSFSSNPSNEYSGLISFRIDWFDLHAVQVTLKSLLQHHNSKTSILRYQLSLWSNAHIFGMMHTLKAN